MTLSRRNLIVASAFAAIAFQAPAHAIGIDPSIDYGSLKAEFAAEDAGASYGYKLRDVRRAKSTKRRGFTTKRRNFGTKRKRK